MRREEHPDPKIFTKSDLQFGGAGAQEINGQATENSGAVAAGAIGIHTATVREALESLQCKLQDFVGGRSGKARDETCTTGIVVRVPPVRLAPPATHSRVIEADDAEVQSRISMECIGNARASRKASILELRNFAEVEIADFHWGNNHFERFLGGGAAGRAEGLDILEHLQN